MKAACTKLKKLPKHEVRCAAKLLMTSVVDWAAGRGLGVVAAQKISGEELAEDEAEARPIESGRQKSVKTKASTSAG